MDIIAPRQIVAPVSDRRFFTGMAVAVALSVFAGFAPTYYLKALYGRPALSQLVHVHGLLFTAWIVLLVTQTTLVATNRTALHKKLGLISGMLAIAMIVAATVVALGLARRGEGPGGPLAFLAVPLSGVVLFATLVGAGFYTRRRRDTHKRLMLLATMSIAGAGLDRLLLPPGVLAFTGVPLNSATSAGLMAIFVCACFTYDLRTRGRVHPAFLWGGLYLMTMVSLSRFIGTTSPWLAFAGWLIR
jgi:hypothetical protein